MSGPSAGRPQPRPTPISRPFWEATARGELRIQHCEACAANVFYPRATCPECGSRELAWRTASGRGTVYSFTVARRPTHPAFADRVPYVIAIVELEEGPHLTTNVVGCAPEAVRIGLPVRVDFEAAVDGIAVPVFRPDEEP